MRSTRRRSKGTDPDRLYAALESGVDVPGRTIFLFGAITDESIARVVIAIEMFDQSSDTVRIVMSSCGGEVDAGFTLYDAIRMARCPIVIDCYGVVQSMATMILQAATVRRLSPECRVMVHAGSASLDSVATTSVLDVATEIQRSHDRYCEIIAERSKRPMKEIAELCDKESYLDSEAAIKAGLADSTLNVYNPMRIEKVKKKK